MGGCFYVQPFWQVMLMNFLPIAFLSQKGADTLGPHNHEK